MVSHENLVCNLEMMKAALGAYTEEDQAQGAVSWLPLYHDMGLVGCLYMGLYFPGNVTYLRPDLFLAKPAVWLQTISRRRAVISAAPNFAYGLCLKKVTDADMEGVDLSSWRMALNGAEPIELRTAEQFAERFGRWGFPRTAMTPVYGLAEAGLGVSFSAVDQPPHTVEFDRDALSLEDRAVPGEGRRMVSVGRPLPGLEVEIQDESGAALPEGRVGRIMARGPSITRGYFQDPGLTADIIRHGWLDTGDLGFLHDGHLYISGRLKDLIIIRGRNYAPQEVEELLLDVPGLRTGCAVAVSTMVEDEGEQLIVLGERDTIHPRPDEEVVADINGRVLKGLSLSPHHVELLPPGTLPRTSSGKLRRSDALKQFLTGELVPPEKVTALKLLKELGRSQLSWARFRLKR
jgi:acyl-CoA synthetase (AMP-forming)/AMP-acid ligase II